MPAVFGSDLKKHTSDSTIQANIIQGINYCSTRAAMVRVFLIGKAFFTGQTVVDSICKKA